MAYSITTPNYARRRDDPTPKLSSVQRATLTGAGKDEHGIFTPAKHGTSVALVTKGYAHWTGCGKTIRLNEAGWHFARTGEERR